MSTSGSLILLEFAGQILALTEQELAQGVERGRALMPTVSATDSQAATERLLDADQLFDATGVPSSWWSDAARRGSVPFYRFGKYPRFRLTEVLGCDTFKRRTK